MPGEILPVPVHVDGTPEEIFDHPKRENTRRFIRHLKVLRLEIDADHHDYTALAGEIRRYCAKNQVGSRLAVRIQLAFEEVLHQLSVSPSGIPKALVVVEYSHEREQADMVIDYNGPAYDVTGHEDDLSVKVLKSMIPEIRYTVSDSEEYPNRVILKIRNK